MQSPAVAIDSGGYRCWLNGAPPKASRVPSVRVAKLPMAPVSPAATIVNTEPPSSVGGPSIEPLPRLELTSSPSEVTACNAPLLGKEVERSVIPPEAVVRIQTIWPLPTVPARCRVECDLVINFA